MAVTFERSATAKKVSAHIWGHHKSEEGNYLTVIGISGHKFSDVNKLTTELSSVLGAEVTVVEYSGVLVQWKYSVRKYLTRFTKWIFV